jgi:plastocyanin
MVRFASAAFAAVLLLAMLARPSEAQRRQLIRLEANPEKDTYQFIPSSVTARPGDVLVFKAVRGAPHSIVFEGADLNEATHEAMNGAMVRRTGDLSSPLLTENGAEYRMTVPRVAPGSYRFYCLPHRAYDMRGELRITK